jgi:hypothetical protein
MLLGAAYFDVQREVIFDPNTLTTIAEPQSGVFRTICICKPARSINSLHLYQPPFGLSKYDLRRKLPPQEWLSYLPRPGYAPKFVLPADDQAEAD